MTNFNKKYYFVENETIGCLTAVKEIVKHKKRHIEVLCNCGNRYTMLISTFKSIPHLFCNKCRGVELQNRKFGRLTVIEKLHLQGHIKWKCLCDCGNFSYPTTQALIHGHTKSCGCYDDEVKRQSDMVGMIRKTFWTIFLRKCKKRKIDVKITREEAWKQFLKQDGKCSISGIPLTFSNCTRDYSGTASIDRIDSRKAYTLDNIQWVHKVVNVMKWDMSDNEFVNFCHIISNFQKNKS